MLTRPMDVLTAFPVRKSKQQKQQGIKELICANFGSAFLGRICTVLKYLLHSDLFDSTNIALDLNLHK